MTDRGIYQPVSSYKEPPSRLVFAVCLMAVCNQSKQLTQTQNLHISICNAMCTQAQYSKQSIEHS